MDLPDQQCKERKKKKCNNGRKREIIPGFIPLLKASNTLSLFLQKPRDVANLDTLESNFLLFDVVDETTGLSSLHVQYKQEKNSTQHETGSSAWAAPLLLTAGGRVRKAGKVIPKGTRGSEWGGRSWGASQGHPLAAQSQWAKESTCQDLPLPYLLVRRQTWQSSPSIFLSFEECMRKTHDPFSLTCINLEKHVAWILQPFLIISIFPSNLTFCWAHRTTARAVLQLIWGLPIPCDCKQSAAYWIKCLLCISKIVSTNPIKNVSFLSNIILFWAFLCKQGTLDYIPLQGILNVYTNHSRQHYNTSNFCHMHFV